MRALAISGQESYSPERPAGVEASVDILLRHLANLCRRTWCSDGDEDFFGRANENRCVPSAIDDGGEQWVVASQAFHRLANKVCAQRSSNK
jgi:hypothetical protein